MKISATMKMSATLALLTSRQLLMKVGRLRTIAFCILFAALLITSTGNGATIQVSSNLQTAIDAASPGDTLLVAAGVYDKITIQKSLNLRGNGTVIRAGNRDACVNIDADNVSISGFVVRDGFYGIKLNHANGCIIANNTVIYCAQPGIALLFSDGNTITGNNASFNGIVGEGWYGIYLSNSNDNLITNNVAYGNGAYGINLFPSCSNNTIRGNVLQGNMYGLYMFRDCAKNLIENNNMSRNTNSGLDLRINCTGNLILNNTMENNVVAGLTLMEDSGGNTIGWNVIQGNGRYGLQVQSRSDGNTIIYNNISGSQTGIFLDSDENKIYGNRISDNTIQADDRGKNCWNAQYPKGGNLWSDYLGQDEMQGPEQDAPGKDGIGDEPYRISENGKDQYPIIDGQVKQIVVLAKELTPAELRLGDSVAIKASLQSKYDLLQVTARAYQDGWEAQGYSRLVLSGDFYQGEFSTALLEPGIYDIVLSARDARGYELRESLGTVKITTRRGQTST
ncbi:MAG: right-handed parallel beta-helix repeat-containing protein [Methanotrichaceae archaeon]|nr:right-handed parallel beta-helix repeat-containing protein [Methanotrichaceae archaeon]